MKQDKRIGKKDEMEWKNKGEEWPEKRKKEI